MVLAYPVHLRLAHHRLCGKIRPAGDGFAHLLQDLRRTANAESVGHRQQIRTIDPDELAFDGHQMLIRPFPGRVIGMRDVIGRGELPGAPLA